MKYKFKPWIVLILCCLLISSSVGLSINSSGVFYTKVSESLNLLRGSFAFHMTIFSLTNATTALFIPKLIKKYSYKNLLIFGVSLTFISTFLMGLSERLFIFYLLGALRGIGTGFFCIAPITIIINGWFHKRNGLATSIALGFSGIASTIFSPIFSYMIETIGWEKSYFIKSIIIFILVLPSIIFSFSIKAESDNYLPYGFDKTLNTESKESKNKNLTLLNSSYILLFILSFFITIISGVTQHLPGFAVSIGYDSSFGAKLLSFAMIGNVLFKIIIGALSDKIGPILSTFFMMLINIFGTSLLLLFNTPLTLLLASLLFGASYSVHAVGLPLLTKYFFGKENYLKAFPPISFASNIGVALSLSLVGYIYDLTGSYKYSLILTLFLNLLGFIFISLILKENNKRT